MVKQHMRHEQSKSHELGRFQKWLITGKPLTKIATISVTVFSVSLLLGLLTPHQHRNQTAHSTSTTLLAISLPLLIIGAVLYILIRKQLLFKVITDREIYLEIDLNDADKIALYKWSRYGEVPTSKKLQSILEKYLEYRKLIATGERQPLGSNWQQRIRWIFALSALLNTMSYVLRGVSDHHAFVTHLLDTVLIVFGALFYLTVTSTSVRLRPLRYKLAAPQLKRLARMRAQIQ